MRLTVANHGNAFLAGGGEMGALMREHDWSTSPLDSPENWPQWTCPEKVESFPEMKGELDDQAEGVYAGV